MEEEGQDLEVAEEIYQGKGGSSNFLADTIPLFKRKASGDADWGSQQPIGDSGSEVFKNLKPRTLTGMEEADGGGKGKESVRGGLGFGKTV